LKKILFFIHDLGPGGAEKVLVNLVNNMDPEKFNITVMTLIGGGVNEQFLKPHIRYMPLFKWMIRGHSYMMAALSPRQLHRLFIKDTYDIEVSYLEGPTARIISGCPNPDTKLVSWVHIEQHTHRRAQIGFRSYREMVHCQQKFKRILCVSEYVKNDFSALYPQLNQLQVLYNTNETDQILKKMDEPIDDIVTVSGKIRMCGVGKLIHDKGFDRILRIHRRLVDQGYPIHTYLLGTGSERDSLEKFVRQNDLTDSVTFLGYKTNPYKYVANCDLFLCASLAEGFSTAATEALIVGTPVCTVEVSGMKEMLGENNEYGIVTENDEEALYQGIKSLLDDPALLDHYKKQAKLRGKAFSTQNTVRAVEEMLNSL
jgi:glycosyltransferase involved in cell wall biosynthesis